MTQPTNSAIALAEGVSSDLFQQLLDLAIKGRPPLPGAKAAARGHLQQKGDHEAAIRQLITEHVALAGGQGFATNWGGFFVALATIPANIIAASFVQTRMVAAIAHLRGYELVDPRVRTAIGIVLLGPSGAASLVEKGVLPTSASAVATAPMYDAQLDRAVGRALVERVSNEVGGKRLGVWVGKRIPMVGGGVGAAVDGYTTHRIAQHALQELPSRRPKQPGNKTAADGQADAKDASDRDD